MEKWKEFLELLDHTVLDVSLGRMLTALLVFLFLFFLRHLFSRTGLKVFRKIAGRTKTDVDDKLIDAIEPPLSFLFFIAGLWFAFKIIHLPDASKILFKQIIRSLLVFSAIWAGYRATGIVSDFLARIAKKTENNLDDQLVQFFGKFLKVGVIILGVMIIVREWGYDIAGLIAGLGIGGLAFALAAKDTVANLFGSITILIDRPFGIGDWIETPQLEGTVEDIKLRSTLVRTFANAVTSVPNSILANTPVTNWSRMKKRRIKYRLGLTYGSKVSQVEECVKRIREMLQNHPAVHKDVIFVRFTDFGESALELFLYFFTNTTVWGEYLEVREELNLKIMRIVEELGLSIAFPSRSIYLERTGEKESLPGGNQPV